ncbi:hypothetical protein [Ectobacillus panaciterrae]|uniref:hypothetical protein n=1 Tax=Ectobacillus panaciterrae TaxID=363872 RepID=UPI0003FA6A11|nr:hypothetical protein [Ectobacillus panaciterrae]
MKAQANERDNILQTQAAIEDAKKSYKKEVIHEETVDVSPVTTVSRTGEVAPGALGGLSFDELTGRDLVGEESPVRRWPDKEK